MGGPPQRRQAHRRHNGDPTHQRSSAISVAARAAPSRSTGRHVERAYPSGDLRVVLDNVSTHKTPDVRAWLERHPRITFHCTPTSASWMNQIETWFGILTRGALRRGSVGSVKELIAKIELFTAHWNAGSSPFAWVKTADEILAKAVRKRPAISESRH